MSKFNTIALVPVLLGVTFIAQTAFALYFAG